MSIKLIYSYLQQEEEEGEEHTAEPLDLIRQQKQMNSTEYLVFDEHILQTMVEKGWNRTQGYSILMPMAFGMCKEWWKHKMIEEQHQL